jgi:GT2 family glycosyltransferase
MSEDWDISYKLRELGYEIYIDSSFSISHFGFHNYSRGPALNNEIKKRGLKYD